MMRYGKSIAVGMAFTLMIKQNNSVYAVGGNGSGQLGLGHRDNIFRPAVITDLSYW